MKSHNDILFLLYILLSILFMTSCVSGKYLLLNNESPSKKELQQQKNPYAEAQITTRIIPSVNNTFGYDIIVNGKTLVHQPHIPGLPGNDGFTTKERAQTVAEFVVRKIRNNEVPPTVKIEDLHNMGVLQQE